MNMEEKTTTEVKTIFWVEILERQKRISRNRKLIQVNVGHFIIFKNIFGKL